MCTTLDIIIGMVLLFFGSIALIFSVLDGHFWAALGGTACAIGGCKHMMDAIHGRSR